MTPRRPLRRLPRLAAGAALALASGVLPAAPAAASAAAPQPAPPVVALPDLDIPGYMGTWYQVAWFPNRFQKQCVSDTTATYRRVENGVEVTNRCRTADGRIDAVTGLARPLDSRIETRTDGERLVPARLEVSFLPTWLRWLPVWGSYWVVLRADDGRYAVVSEPTREYLWVLARQPKLAPADEVASPAGRRIRTARRPTRPT
ncbi:MAG: lipocalin family protein [Rubrivivax sp.]|nr:lipocalin family protein [Rubrivivax sp.]